MGLISLGVSYWVKFPMLWVIAFLAYQEWKDEPVNAANHRDFARVTLVAATIAYLDYNVGN